MARGLRSAVSHQLRLLRHLGLVVGQRDGRRVVYELHDDHVGELLEQVVAHVDHVRLGVSGRDRTEAAAPA
jgi:DNA-binding transcriptional ArsR family regulator